MASTAVTRPGAAAAEGDGPDVHLGPQPGKPRAHPDDVADRVVGADFMEVHICRRHPVHRTFGDSETLESLVCQRRYGLVEVGNVE